MKPEEIERIKDLLPDVAALLQRRRDAANGVTNTVTNTGS